VLLVALAPAWGAVRVRERAQDGVTLITLQNEHLALTFNPARGGRCVSFRFLDTNEEIIGTDDTAGMFLDHWAKYTWPSGLMHLPYQYALSGDGTDEGIVRLWVVVPETGGGKGEPGAKASLALPTSPDLVGLTVQKTIRLRAGSDRLQVTQEVINTTPASRAAAVYIQHNFNLGGSRYGNTWYLPSTRGIEYNVQPDAAGGRALGTDWVLDPTGGWIAARNRTSGRALLFAFDYNYLQKIYTCGSTAEWFLEPVPIGPGTAFRTDYVIAPAMGFTDVVHGSQDLMADIQADEVGGKVRVRHDVAAVGATLRNLTVTVTVTGWRSKQRLAEKTFRLALLDRARQRQEFTVTPTALTDGVVIRVQVQGAGVDERYEYYYAGDTEEYERRHNPSAVKGQALAGARGDAYFRKPPRKQKTYVKPDWATVARPDPAQYRVLVVFGLYTHILNLDDALADWTSTGGRTPEFSWANCPPNAVEMFPGSYDELFAYHAIVLSDVNYRALGDTGFEMLCDYVEQGGRLLITGGPYAFGNGEFEETRVLTLLPVTLSGPFDLKWAGKGQSWDLQPVQAGDPLLAGVDFTSAPKVFWRHQVTPKAGATVHLTAGGHPALVTGRYGKGKVAVLTLSPTGKAAPGETAWWGWDGWSALLRNIVTWLSA
jgi:uncharacterized membrane protein